MKWASDENVHCICFHWLLNILGKFLLEIISTDGIENRSIFIAVFEFKLQHPKQVQRWWGGSQMMLILTSAEKKLSHTEHWGIFLWISWRILVSQPHTYWCTWRHHHGFRPSKKNNMFCGGPAFGSLRICQPTTHLLYRMSTGCGSHVGLFYRYIRCRTAGSFGRDGVNWHDACLIHTSIRVQTGKWMGYLKLLTFEGHGRRQISVPRGKGGLHPTGGY